MWDDLTIKEFENLLVFYNDNARDNEQMVGCQIRF